MERRLKAWPKNLTVEIHRTLDAKKLARFDLSLSNVYLGLTKRRLSSFSARRV